MTTAPVKPKGPGIRESVPVNRCEAMASSTRMRLPKYGQEPGSGVSPLWSPCTHTPRGELGRRTGCRGAGQAPPPDLAGIVFIRG